MNYLSHISAAGLAVNAGLVAGITCKYIPSEVQKSMQRFAVISAVSVIFSKSLGALLNRTLGKKEVKEDSEISIAPLLVKQLVPPVTAAVLGILAGRSGLIPEKTLTIAYVAVTAALVESQTRQILHVFIDLPKEEEIKPEEEVNPGFAPEKVS